MGRGGRGREGEGGEGGKGREGEGGRESKHFLDPRSSLSQRLEEERETQQAVCWGLMQSFPGAHSINL